MPFVNVIKGEPIPSAPFNVRTPILRIPWWMIITWQAIKALAWLLVAYLRFWYATLPATLLAWLYLRYGWPGPAILAGSVTGLAAGWRDLHPTSWLRVGWLPILARLPRP